MVELVQFFVVIVVVTQDAPMIVKETAITDTVPLYVQMSAQILVQVAVLPIV